MAKPISKRQNENYNDGLKQSPAEILPKEQTNILDSTINNLSKAFSDTDKSNKQSQQNSNSEITKNFSEADIEKINQVKNLIKSPNFQLDKKPNGKIQTHKIRNGLIKEVRGDFIELKKDLQVKHEREPAAKVKELTLSELKHYYKASYKRMQQQVKLIQALETDKTLNPNEQEAVKALAKAVELTMKKINEKFVENQVKMEKELEKIRQIEEHEEKTKQKKGKGKSVGKFVVKQFAEAAGGLYDILCQPWSKEDKIKAISEEKDLDGKSKTTDKKDEKSLVKEQTPKAEKSNHKKINFDAYSADLGNLSPSSAPLDHGFKKQKQEAIPADFYSRRNSI